MYNNFGLITYKYKLTVNIASKFILQQNLNVVIYFQVPH